jgi:hypothetical protein
MSEYELLKNDSAVLIKDLQKYKKTSVPEIRGNEYVDVRLKF